LSTLEQKDSRLSYESNKGICELLQLPDRLVERLAVWLVTNDKSIDGYL